VVTGLAAGALVAAYVIDLAGKLALALALARASRRSSTAGPPSRTA
jgi:hypothetical protein